MEKFYKKLRISEIISRYPPGTRVSVFGVDGVPDETVCTVEFVDDLGYLFIETPEGFNNIRFSPADENVRFVLCENGS